MVHEEADTKADFKAVEDRGESIGLMEPLLIGADSRHRVVLTDLALELAQKSAGFRRSLPDSLTASLADLVRAMSCYYSNLIEGHDTPPIDIERALKGFSWRGRGAGGRGGRRGARARRRRRPGGRRRREARY